jgi:hypothetical protein
MPSATSPWSVRQPDFRVSHPAMSSWSGPERKTLNADPAAWRSAIFCQAGFGSARIARGLIDEGDLSLAAVGQPLVLQT